MTDTITILTSRGPLLTKRWLADGPVRLVVVQKLGDQWGFMRYVGRINDLSILGVEENLTADNVEALRNYVNPVPPPARA
jgi:hypothetical protein